MNNIIKTTVISPETASLDGFYHWVGAENDCPYHGEIRGYECGYCVESRNDNGELGYSSVVFLPFGSGTDIALPELDNGDLADWWNDLGISACHWNGNWKPTGRLVFRGYYTSHYDWEEREEYFKNASREVLALWDKWVIN